MSELRKDPSPQQLLDWFVQLEREMARLKREEIEPLKAENARLRNDLNGLFEAFKADVSDTTTHINEINDYLWPVVYKIFPHIAEGHREIFKFIDENGAPKANKKKAD